MYDGMGWFRAIDFKCMLLTYDEIHYLIPKEYVEFEDIDGERRFLFSPVVFRRICHSRYSVPFLLPWRS
jgi:hypothetical protein